MKPWTNQRMLAPIGHVEDWAFYAFREDAWHGMDYELGTDRVPPGYWAAVERGDEPPRIGMKSPIWQALHAALNK